MPKSESKSNLVSFRIIQHHSNSTEFAVYSVLYTIDPTQVQYSIHLYNVTNVVQFKKLLYISTQHYKTSGWKKKHPDLIAGIIASIFSRFNLVSTIDWIFSSNRPDVSLRNSCCSLASVMIRPPMLDTANDWERGSFLC